VIARGVEQAAHGHRYERPRRFSGAVDDGLGAGRVERDDRRSRVLGEGRQRVLFAAHDETHIGLGRERVDEQVAEQLRRPEDYQQMTRQPSEYVRRATGRE
jgi:hypothetical protein